MNLASPIRNALISAYALPTELVGNGDFSTSSYWTIAAGWTIADGKLNAGNLGTGSYQELGIVAGRTYRVRFTISNTTQFTCHVQLGGTTVVAGAVNGSYDEEIVAGSDNSRIQFNVGGSGDGWDGSVDGVSVREIVSAFASVQELPAYKSSYPIFTSRPVPNDAPYPMIVISPDIISDNQDGINDQRPLLVRDVVTYGRNDIPTDYRKVETIAFAVRDRFHRHKDSLTVSGWAVTDIVTRGPIRTPADDEQTFGLNVELTVRLALQN